MAREICEISTVEVAGNELVLVRKVTGRFVLDGDKLTYDLEQSDSGTALMFKRILAEDIPVYVNGQMVAISSQANPDLWFYALPRCFDRSTYINAQMVS